MAVLGKVMKRYQIKNEELTLEIDSLGAEMKSLKYNASGQEYLWQADPAYWGRTSPVLFPLVGNYREKKTEYEGTYYTLSQHGFARDMEFSVTAETDGEIWFSLSDTEATRAVYPFRFRLELGYRLSGREVEVLWRVTNTDEKTMYFSIGGHPAFLCPLNPEESQTDCRLGFDAKGPLICSVLGESGLVSEETREFVLEEGQLPIEKDLFDRDALIIENHQAHCVSLAGSDRKPYVEVSFDAPLFGVWSPAGKHAPFVCIEPWYGRSDREDFSQKLSEREWGNTLEPGEVFEKSYRIRII